MFSGRQSSLLTVRNLELDQAHMGGGGDPPADGQVSKRGEEGEIKEEQNRHPGHTCKHAI